MRPRRGNVGCPSGHSALDHTDRRFYGPAETHGRRRWSRVNTAEVERLCRDHDFRPPRSIVAGDGSGEVGTTRTTQSSHSDVEISPWLDAEAANQVLCHELRHVQQAQQIPWDEFINADRWAPVGTSPHDLPTERDAHAAAKRWTSEYRVVD